MLQNSFDYQSQLYHHNDTLEKCYCYYYKHKHKHINICCYKELIQTFLWYELFALWIMQNLQEKVQLNYQKNKYFNILKRALNMN